MPVIVSDTSPVRALAHLELLPWLQALFSEVIVPPAVAEELEHPPEGDVVVVASDWKFIEVISPQNTNRVMELRMRLDAGESEAIALAEELQAELLLIDESTGRRVATECGRKILGTLGILLQAKQAGLCTEIRFLLDRLQSEFDFFVSPALRTFVLEQAAEQE